MLLCDKCHKETGCKYGVLHSISYGRCGKCGKSDTVQNCNHDKAS